MISRIWKYLSLSSGIKTVERQFGTADSKPAKYEIALSCLFVLVKHYLHPFYLVRAPCKYSCSSWEVPLLCLTFYSSLGPLFDGIFKFIVQD